MDEDQAESYGAIKAAVLPKYRRNDNDQQRFHSTIVLAGETFRELQTNEGAIEAVDVSRQPHQGPD